jgi:hypothetical protein
MVDKLDFKAIEKRLAMGDVSKDELKEYTQLISPLAKYGIRNILIRGTPKPEGITAHIQVDAEKIGELSTALAGIRSSAVVGWRVFPWGIPWPDIFSVEIDVGRPPAVGPAAATARY